MARAMAALKVAKIVVNGTEPEARLLYRLLTMLWGTSGTTDLGVAVAKGGAYELLEAGSAEVGYERVVGRGDELVPGASGCSSREAVVEEG